MLRERRCAGIYLRVPVPCSNRRSHRRFFCCSAPLCLAPEVLSSTQGTATGSAGSRGGIELWSNSPNYAIREPRFQLAVCRTRVFVRSRGLNEERVSCTTVGALPYLWPSQELLFREHGVRWKGIKKLKKERKKESRIRTKNWELRLGIRD